MLCAEYARPTHYAPRRQIAQRTKARAVCQLCKTLKQQKNKENRKKGLAIRF
jgi:hypothetical protein